MERFVIDPPAGLDLNEKGFAVAVDPTAWGACELSAAEIERRLVGGEDRIEVFGPNGETLVYEVPSWTEHPIRRLRIALARRSASRSS